jgi:hypothetical protein
MHLKFIGTTPPSEHAEIYRQRISALYESFQDQQARAEAAEVFRTLVDQVILVPDGNALAIVLRGDLAAMLTFAAGKKKPDLLSETGLLGNLISQESVVAGAGFEPAARRHLGLKRMAESNQGQRRAAASGGEVRPALTATSSPFTSPRPPPVLRPDRRSGCGR